MPYLGRSPTQAVRARYYYTVASGATSVTGSDDNSNTLIFSDGEFVDVSLNGVTLVAGTDYVTTTANTIGSLSAMSANDVVEVVVYDVFSVFDGNVNSDFSIGGTLNVASGVVFNEDSADVDFRVESNGNANMLFVDGGNDKVGVGHGSPTAILDVRRGDAAGVVAEFHNTSGFGIDIGTDSDSVAYISSGYTQAFSLKTNAGSGQVERMRIDSSGNVGIGTSTFDANTKLQVFKSSGNVHIGMRGADNASVSAGFVNASGNAVYNGMFGDQSGGAGKWGVYNGGLRLVVDNGGQVHIGRTASATNASGVSLQPNAQSQFVTMGNDVKTLAVGSGNDVQLTVLEFLSGGDVRGSVSVTSSATAFNTSSDVRLKENIKDAKSSGSIIDQIQVREFDWKKSGEHQRHGMIAQELNEVAPEAVTTDEVHEGDMWTVDYSKLVPMMMKEIQDLRKRLTALEG